MLLRHSVIYFFARGVPGVINFLALMIYTRLLVPEEYGQYALTLTVVGFINVVLWQWLRLGLLRFLTSYEGRQEAFLSTIAVSFLFLVIVSAGMFGLARLLFPEKYWLGLSALALMLLWTQAWFELNLELARSRMSPLLYGGLASAKAITAIVIGVWLAYLGYGATGVLIGLLVALTVPGMWMLWRMWRVVRVHRIDREIFMHLVGYGLPLTATFALNFVLNSSDRLLIGWLMGAESVGLYAVGYDLASQTLGMLMAIINLASYPIVVRKLELQSEEAAKSQMQVNAALLLIVAMPVTVMWMQLAPNVAGVVVGDSYVDSAASLMPIIALSTFIFGLQSHHFALAFQLGKRTVPQIWVMLLAALVNVVLNLLWIPAFGLMGAAYATLVACSVALVMSWLLGRSVFVVPMPSYTFKICIAVAVMALAIWPMAEWRGAAALASQIVVGVIAYAAALLLLDVGNIRRRVNVRLAEMRQ